MKKKSLTTVSVFTFINYREFLRAYFEELKRTQEFFSYRYLERVSGLSRSYFKLLIDGKCNLSYTATTMLAKSLGLSKKEINYFKTLVLYNQAQSDDEKDRYFDQILELRPRTAIEGITPDQYEFFTKTYFVEIHQLAALPGFKADPAWICKNLRRHLKPKQIQQALEVLERLGLLARNSRGELEYFDTTLATPTHAESMDIFNYHRQLLNEAKEAIVTAPYDEWDVGTVTIPMPKEILPEVMDRLKKCREDIADLVNRGAKNYHEVFQVNMQMFPISKSHSAKNSTKKGDEESS